MEEECKGRRGYPEAVLAHKGEFSVEAKLAPYTLVHLLIRGV